MKRRNYINSDTKPKVGDKVKTYMDSYWHYFIVHDILIMIDNDNNELYYMGIKCIKSYGDYYIEGGINSRYAHVIYLEYEPKFQLSMFPI